MDQTRVLALLEKEYERNGELSCDRLKALARESDISFTRLAGTASFYARFNKKQMGEVSDCKVPADPLPGEVRRILSQPADYAGLKAALKKSPDEILEEMMASGLRGRGGAGFPTGLKWKTTKECTSPVKYVVINADEGEPDTAKDGAILRKVPHAVLEGMMICGFCAGASKGYIYIRAEYPKEKQILEREIMRAKKAGLLGEHICGTSFSFDAEIVVGAGSYVCGEETALLSSLEGQRGEPRLKPPFPGVAGLFQMPTVVNNTETIANVPLVFRMGADAYREFGTEKNPGTKLFTVCGEVEKPGVYEYPLGTPVANVLTEAGWQEEHTKLVQIGGGASGCLLLPEGLKRATLDIEGMSAVNGSLGTGSIRVFGNDTDIVELCRRVAVFFREESCGKCTPCRFGTGRIAEMLDAAVKDPSRSADSEELYTLASYITDNARCAFGQSACTVLLAALKLFPEEFAAKSEKREAVKSKPSGDEEGMTEKCKEERVYG